MPAIAITGGIATGKSTFTRLFTEATDAAAFDADACARELLVSDAAALADLRAEFGPDVFAADGQVDRAALREIVFAHPERRGALEAIFAPACARGVAALAGNPFTNRPRRAIGSGNSATLRNRSGGVFRCDHRGRLPFARASAPPDRNARPLRGNGAPDHRQPSSLGRKNPSLSSSHLERRLRGLFARQARLCAGRYLTGEQSRGSIP